MRSGILGLFEDERGKAMNVIAFERLPDCPGGMHEMPEWEFRQIGEVCIDVQACIRCGIEQITTASLDGSLISEIYRIPLKGEG